MRILPTIWTHMCKVSRVAVQSFTISDGQSHFRAGPLMSFSPHLAGRAIESSDPGVLGAYWGGVGYVGHQSISRNLTEQPGLEVFHGLPKFRCSVHHEGAIRRHRFANGLSTQDEQLQ